MRTEARVGRPFSIPREIAEICNGAILRTPEGEVVIEGESAKALDVTWQDSQPGQIQLVLDIDGSTVRKAARKAKVDLEAVEVVALAAVPMLRHTEVIWRERLSRLDGEVVVDVVQGGSSTFREMLEMMESARDFMKDLSPVLHQVGLDAVHKMNEFEQQGYFEIFRNLTDPGILEGLRRASSALATVKMDEKLDNKSLVGIFRRLNSPEVRKSLSYTLRLVEAMGKS